MANSAEVVEKTLSDGSKYWRRVKVCYGVLKILLCHLLIIVCTIALSILHYLSSCFASWKEILKMIISADDSNEEQIKHRRTSYSSNSQNPSQDIEVINKASNVPCIIDDPLPIDCNEKIILENKEVFLENKGEVMLKNVETKTDIKVEKRCPVKRNASLNLFNKAIQNTFDSYRKEEIVLKERKSETKKLDTKKNIDLNDYKINPKHRYGQEYRKPIVVDDNVSYETLGNGNLFHENEYSANTLDSFYKEFQSIEPEPIKSYDCSKVPNDNCENAMLNKNNANRKNHDSRDYKKPIVMLDKWFNLVEKKCDILSLPPEFTLAICATDNLQFSSGSAYCFRTKFDGVGKLFDQNLHLGDVGEIVYQGQFIFYLVVKEKYRMAPTKHDMEKSLVKLYNKMKSLKLTKLAIPSYGFDRFNMNDALELTSKVFSITDVQVTICTKEQKLDTPPSLPSKVNSTQKQLWEMEPQTDIIIFINMEKMYLDDWEDRIVDNINFKHPFKEKLLEDINVKPVAAGDVLNYKINNEELFCIFIKPIDKNPCYFECLSKAFHTMKSQMTGYRYLAIQRESINDPNVSGIPRHILLLQTVFSTIKAEIWICNDNDLCEVNQFKHYKNFVTNTMVEKHNKLPKSSGKQKLKSIKGQNISKMHSVVSSYNKSPAS